MFYGFHEVCMEVWDRNPKSYVVGLKFNGSGVETLFSQIKQRAGQELTGANYLTARRSLLATRDVQFGKRKKRDDYEKGGYRNTSLNVSCSLKKKRK